MKPAVSVIFKHQNPIEHERSTQQSYDPCEGFPHHINIFYSILFYGVSCHNWSTLFIYFFTRHVVNGWVEKRVDQLHSINCYCIFPSVQSSDVWEHFATIKMKKKKMKVRNDKNTNCQVKLEWFDA